ncbi:MAG: hypothetical protein LAN63_09450 [Acidobacteriia bacterium]|nr:hypothetical protein [Terriglobia bacterium]
MSNSLAAASVLMIWKNGCSAPAGMVVVTVLPYWLPSIQMTCSQRRTVVKMKNFALPHGKKNRESSVAVLTAPAMTILEGAKETEASIRRLTSRAEKVNIQPFS